MKILVTGAQGFMGKNLVSQLQNMRDGKVPGAPLAAPLDIGAYDLGSDPAMLEAYCRDCDFVFHLAGVNRPQNDEEFMQGNFGFTSTLLDTLKRFGNACPVMLSSSIQAALDNPYGVSKRAGEELLRAYGTEAGAPVYIYRFPNVFGKWCRPNYNSAIATFCHNLAHGLPITVNDPARVMHLVYIDDVVDELIRAAAGTPCMGADGFCRVPVEHSATLGNIAALLRSFRESRTDLSVPQLDDPLAKKLYSTYLSYLPEDGFSYPLTTHADARGSFTEMLRTGDRGQVSINVSKPGITKGNHWHRTKNEKFLVVSGTGCIRFRKVGEEAVREYPVSGNTLEVVDIPVGYTHSIVNTGSTDMVTVMWCNECFDPEHPDTFFLEV